MLFSGGSKQSIVFHSRTVTVFLILLFSSPIFAQLSEFIPKSKKEIEKEKQFELSDRKKLFSSGIYSINSVKYNYRYGKIEKNGITESTVRFDDKGRKIREITYNPSDGTLNTTTNYRYDKNGNLVEQMVKKGESTIKTIHRYNFKNSRVESVIYKADGTVERKISYVYDDIGLLLETFGKLDDGRLFMRDSYLYDGQGNIIEFKNNLKKIISQYDPKGNIISIEKYQRYFKAHDTVQYNISERIVFEYNTAGHLIEMRSYRPDSSVKSRTQYVRNALGTLLEEKEFSVDGKLVYTRALKYDPQQNLIEESGSDRALKFKNSYRYDLRGNKTEMVTYDQINEPVSVTKFLFGKYGVNTSAPNPAVAASDDSLFADDSDPLNSEEFFQMLGSRIIAPDGTYLGMVLADTSNPQSIINSWGQYGFSQSPTSIFNPSIPYGGEKGIFSPFNPESPSPPSVYKDGKFYTYLTANDSYRPRSAPHKLVEFLKKLVKQN